MLNHLTQEQKYTMAKFYKLYMERSNEGQSEAQANFFDDAQTAHDQFFCDRNYDDFVHNCKILIDHGYLKGDVKNDNINNIKVTTKTFIEIEQSFS
ncbi:Phage protein [Staphylococcus simiae]|nr:Phage protein [Staphylococcus simiae]